MSGGKSDQGLKPSGQDSSVKACEAPSSLQTASGQAKSCSERYSVDEPTVGRSHFENIAVNHLAIPNPLSEQLARRQNCFVIGCCVRSQLDALWIFLNFTASADVEVVDCRGLSGPQCASTCCFAFRYKKSPIVLFQLWTPETKGVQFTHHQQPNM